MDLDLLVLKVVRRLREVGLWVTFQEGLRRLLLKRNRTPDECDMRHGTDTGVPVPLWKLTIGSPNARFGVKYEATGEQELVDAINFLHENLRTFTFVDLGCGKAELF